MEGTTQELALILGAVLFLAQLLAQAAISLVTGMFPRKSVLTSEESDTLKQISAVLARESRDNAMVLHDISMNLKSLNYAITTEAKSLQDLKEQHNGLRIAANEHEKVFQLHAKETSDKLNSILVNVK